MVQYGKEKKNVQSYKRDSQNVKLNLKESINPLKVSQK